MKRVKALVMIMVMVTALTGSVPAVEAKTKTSITVTNKATGKKIGKKVTLKAGEKVQLKVKYGKKNVTKKAKYKTSNKRIATVNKKGKITAKSAGTCTVKVTYKKAVKKIKVIVKAVETKTEESTTEATTNVEYSEYWTKEDEAALQKTAKKEHLTTEQVNGRRDAAISGRRFKAEQKKPIDQNRINQYIENCQLYSDPHPECDHVWDPVFWSDLYSINPDNFASLCNEHLTLRELVCSKCGCHAVTVPTPFPESKNLTSDEYAKLIDHYRDHTKMTLEQAPHHKHKKVRKYYALPCNHNMYSDEPECEICGTMFNE